MRTEAQNEASRRNGARSHGPITPEGKTISSQNALRHGCTARNVLLDSEDPSAFTQLNAAYYSKFIPADDVERDFVDEMVIARWRLRRDWSNEAALLDLEITRQSDKVKSEYKKIDSACEYALAFRSLGDESHALALASRYETSHRRAFYRALTGLLQLRTVMPASPQPETELPEVAPEHAPIPENNVCETNPAPEKPAPIQSLTQQTEQCDPAHDAEPYPSNPDEPPSEPPPAGENDAKKPIM